MAVKTAVGAETPEPNDQEKRLAIFREMRDVLAPFPSSEFLHLLPTTAQERSDLYRPAVTVVKIDPADQRDVYPTPGGGGTVCLHSQALERIANAAGIDFDPTLARHVHDRAKEPFICEIHVGGWYTDSLGQRRPITAGAVSDLRDGTVTARVLARGLDTARQFICERTESRARNRAIRKTTNLPSSFRPDELKKPLVAVRFRLDERDPDVRRALIDRGTRASVEVFGTSGPALDAGVARAEDEIIEGQVTERGDSSERAGESPSRAERSGSPGEVAGSSPAPRSAPEDPEPVEEVTPEKRASEIRGRIAEARQALPWGKDAREKAATNDQAGRSMGAIAAATGAKLTVDQKKLVWRAVMEFVYGQFGPFSELHNDQVSAISEFAKAHPAEIRELVLCVASTNERLAEIRVALDGQQELGVAS